MAALWCWFFARATRIDLPWHSPVLLALGTWLIYVTDRILDGYLRAPANTLHARHLFHAQHRRAFVGVAVCGGGVVLWLVSARMSHAARQEDTILFSAALLYLILVHKSAGKKKEWLPKELAVGIIFACATVVPAWSRLQKERMTLIPGVALFAALCWINCVAIERWENPNLSLDPRLALNGSHATTRWAASHLRSLAMSLAAAALLTCIGMRLYFPADLPRSAALSIVPAGSALLFAITDRRRQRFSRMYLRIAADLILLTPLLALPWMP